MKLKKYLEEGLNIAAPNAEIIEPVMDRITRNLVKTGTTGLYYFLLTLFTFMRAQKTRLGLSDDAVKYVKMAMAEVKDVVGSDDDETFYLGG